MGHTETVIEGVWYPSVTTILGSVDKPYLENWRKKWGDLADRKMILAGVIGTEFHRRVEAYFNGLPEAWDEKLPDNINRRLDGMMASFMGWLTTVDGIIDSTELKVVSRKYVYSGTLDAVGIVGKKAVLWDWKTGSRIYDDYELQLAAYAQAYNEMTGMKVQEGVIVHVSKDKPSFKVTTRTFKLGKRALNKFLRLRTNFDDMSHLPIEAAGIK